VVVHADSSSNELLDSKQTRSPELTHMTFLTSTDLSLTKSSAARGSRRLDVLLGTQCIDFLIISPSCLAGDFYTTNTHRARWMSQLTMQATATSLLLLQELIRRWDSERELLCSAPGRYLNSLK